METRNAYVSPTAQLAVSQYMSKVYMWMTIGILLTGMVAFSIANSPEALNLILGNKFVFYGKNEKFFFAWNRGRYYFDVTCKNGKDEMDAFMKAFPF